MSNLNKAWRRYLTLSWCLALSCLPFQQSDRGEGPRQHCGWQRCGEDESWTRSTKINSCLSCTYQLRNFWCHQSTFSVTTGQVWSVSLLTYSTIFQSNNFQGIIFVVTCVPDLDLDHLVVYFVSRVLMSTLMVEMKLLALESSRNLSRRHDLPTPESPTWNKHSCRQFSRILVNNTMNSADVSYSTSLLSTRSALFPTEADLVAAALQCQGRSSLLQYMIRRPRLDTGVVRHRSQPRSFLRDCLLLLILDCFCNFPATVSVLQSLLIRIFMTPSKQKLFYFESTSHLPKYFKK